MISKGKWIKLIALIAGLLVYHPHVFSQQIKIVSATCQHWAGGICCRSGVNYSIQLRVIKVKQSIVLDSLWMEGNCADISKYKFEKINKSDTVGVLIQDGITRDEGMPDMNWCFDATKKGVLISYYLGGKKKWLDVTPYLEYLEFIGYP